MRTRSLLPRFPRCVIYPSSIIDDATASTSDRDGLFTISSMRCLTAASSSAVRGGAQASQRSCSSATTATPHSEQKNMVSILLAPVGGGLCGRGGAAFCAAVRGLWIIAHETAWLSEGIAPCLLVFPVLSAHRRHKLIGHVEYEKLSLVGYLSGQAACAPCESPV